MKNTVCLLLCLYFLSTTNGQTSRVQTLTKFELGTQGAGLSYEPGILNKVTVNLGVGVGAAYDVYTDNFTYAILKQAFYFSITPKFFYNIQKRNSKAANTIYNSANYLGITLKSVNTFEPQTDLDGGVSEHVFLTNIHWGIQRSIGGRFLFNTHFGIGYAQDVDCNCGTIYPALDLRVSYILIK